MRCPDMRRGAAMLNSHFTAFGIGMIGQPTVEEGGGVPRRLKERFSARLVALGVFAALAPVAAQAQTNIDEGKSPSQMYAEVCATCHKAPRGLANGRNSGALAGFLAEHYTSSRQQAAALAAYVLGAGGA